MAHAFPNSSSRAGLVVAPDARAAEAGASLLRRGGNAIDAAVAAAFAIGVVEPHMSGLGGGTWLVAALRESERYLVVEGPVVSPAAASTDMYELLTPTRPAGLYGWPGVRNDANFLGAKSVGVPGTVAALCAAHRRLGVRPLAEVIAPAIALAEGGIDVNWFLSAAIVQEARELVGDAGCRALFMPDGFPLRPPGFAAGDRLRQPELAISLAAIAERGPDAFYRGQIAAQLVEFISQAGGVLSRADLDRYKPRVYETPTGHGFGDARIIGTERTGTSTVLQALNLFRLASGDSPTLEELPVAWSNALRLAFFDRMRWMTADPAVPVPWTGLLSQEYAAALWHSHEAAAARPNPAHYQPGHGSSQEAPPSEPSRWGCTSHISVVDRAGNLVALTQTILDNFGARLLEPRTGVIFNDGMTYFDPRPGKRNSIKPGIAGMPAVSPVILEAAGRGPIAALGGAGGRKIISSTAQVIPHLLRGATAQEAIDEPRVHADAESALVDARWPASVAARLTADGFDTTVVTEEPTTWHFARMGAITMLPSGERHGGVDRHKPGGVAVE